MPRSPKCSVCQIDNHEQVDTELQFGMSYREVAKRHGLSLASVGRHAKHHLNLTREGELAKSPAKAAGLAARVARLEAVVVELAVRGELHLEQEPGFVGLEEDDGLPF